MYSTRLEELKNIMIFLDRLQSITDSMKVDIEDNYTSKSSELLNKINHLIDENRESAKELEEPFLLFIMGCGNYGKSTLINTLLNKELVKTNDIPNTWKLDLFVKSEKEFIEINYNDKSKKKMNLKQGSRSLKLEEDKIKRSKNHIAKSVRNYKRNNKVSMGELKRYKTDLEEEKLYRSNIDKVKYYINSSGILDNYIIVDTPGLNQILLKDTEDRVNDFYIKADGVIWLIDAQNIVSSENNNLIEKINEMDKVSQDGKKVIGVVNKMDIIINQNEANIAKVRRRVDEIFENKFTDVVYISAKQANDGIVNNDCELIERSNINSLYESIQKNFTDVCEKEQIDSKYKNLYIMKKDIIKNIYEYKREVYKEISLYNEIDFELKQKCKTLKSYAIGHINNLKNKSFDLEEGIKKLQDNVEKIENQCNKELKKIYESIYNKLDSCEDEKLNEININMYFSKNEKLIPKNIYKENKNKLQTNQIENILNKLTTNIYPNTNPNEDIFKYDLHTQITELKYEVEIIIDEKIKVIENNINQVKLRRFKEGYLNYECIKAHIDYLNDIEKILNSLE